MSSSVPTTKSEFIQSLGLEEMFDDVCMPTDKKPDPFLSSVGPWGVLLSCARAISVRLGGKREQLLSKSMELIHGKTPRYIVEPRHKDDASLLKYALEKNRKTSSKRGTMVVSRLIKSKVKDEARRWYRDWSGGEEIPVKHADLKEWIRYFNNIDHSSLSGKINHHNIDFYGHCFLLEMKSSGDTDGNKSKSVALDDIMASCAIAGDLDSKPYLMIGYDNTSLSASVSDWEGKKSVLKNVDPSLVIFESEFYDSHVLPDFIRWSDIVSTVGRLVLQDFNVNVIGSASQARAAQMIEGILEAQFDQLSTFESFDLLARVSDKSDKLFARKKLKS